MINADQLVAHAIGFGSQVLMTDTPQWRTEWLTRHKNAEVIVTDADGTPVRAEYRTLSGGMFPVAYLYPSNEGINL